MSPLNTVNIQIKPDPAAPPSREIKNIPWYPGMSALDAMIVGDAMFTDTFTFRLVYRSFFGAWVDSIDGVSNTQDDFWMLYVDGVQSQKGISETILFGSQSGGEIDLEWRYENFSALSEGAASAMSAIRSNQ